MDKWISVKERLPEDNVIVLVRDGFDVFPAYQIGGWFYDYADGPRIDIIGSPEAVDYWLPLPAPSEVADTEGGKGK